MFELHRIGHRLRANVDRIRQRIKPCVVFLLPLLDLEILYLVFEDTR